MNVQRHNIPSQNMNLCLVEGGRVWNILNQITVNNVVNLALLFFNALTAILKSTRRDNLKTNR